MVVELGWPCKVVIVAVLLSADMFPSAFVPSPVKINGVLFGIVKSAPADAVGTLFPVAVFIWQFVDFT